MHIAIIADPYIPVPPEHYGGVERVVYSLVQGFVKRGHQVTLFAHPESKVACELVSFGIPPYSSEIKGRWTSRTLEVIQVSWNLFKRRNSFDIVHSFGRLASLCSLFFYRIPKIQSYGRPISAKNVFIANILAGDSITFTACSDNCRKYGKLPGTWKTIYNMIPIEDFEFNAKVPEDAPLVFLGRIERIKGCHTAIDVALKTNKKLIIAGNIVRRDEPYEYFKKEIEPRIDGRQIIYIGEVDDQKKSDLLKNAYAFLMPIECDEAFGIVMAESLACGTPVIGFRRGSVPEIVQNSVNGFICDTKEEMIEAVADIPKLNRKKCREIAENKFGDDVIAEKYLELYSKLIKGVA